MELKICLTEMKGHLIFPILQRLRAQLHAIEWEDINFDDGAWDKVWDDILLLETLAGPQMVMDFSGSEITVNLVEDGIVRIAKGE